MPNLSVSQSVARAERPMHGDIWERYDSGRWFSVMHVCGHHDPPHVTGYWHDRPAARAINPHQHDSIPLPQFCSGFKLVEREEF